jgi:hypothetical protein
MPNRVREALICKLLILCFLLKVLALRLIHDSCPVKIAMRGVLIPSTLTHLSVQGRKHLGLGLAAEAVWYHGCMAPQHSNGESVV